MKHLAGRSYVDVSFLIFILARCMAYVFLLYWHSTDDYRLFCGDLGNEVNDDVLSKAFSRFPSFNMAKVSFYLNLFLKFSYCRKCLLGVIIWLSLFRLLFEVLREVNVFFCAKVGLVHNLTFG